MLVKRKGWLQACWGVGVPTLFWLFSLLTLTAAQAASPLSKVDLVSPPLGLGKAAAVASEHGDLNGSFEFLCTSGARAGFLQVGLFDGFPALKRIDLLKAVLRKPASRLALVR